MVSEQRVLYETRGSTALITLNRPDKLNAITGAMAFSDLYMARMVSYLKGGLRYNPRRRETVPTPKSPAFGDRMEPRRRPGSASGTV